MYLIVNNLESKSDLLISKKWKKIHPGEGDNQMGNRWIVRMGFINGGCSPLGHPKNQLKYIRDGACYIRKQQLLLSSILCPYKMYQKE